MLIDNQIDRDVVQQLAEAPLAPERLDETAVGEEVAVLRGDAAGEEDPSPRQHAQRHVPRLGSIHVHEDAERSYGIRLAPNGHLRDVRRLFGSPREKREEVRTGSNTQQTMQ